MLKSPPLISHSTVSALLFMVWHEKPMGVAMQRQWMHENCAVAPLKFVPAEVTE